MGVEAMIRSKNKRSDLLNAKSFLPLISVTPIGVSSSTHSLQLSKFKFPNGSGPTLLFVLLTSNLDALFTVVPLGKSKIKELSFAIKD